MVSEVVLTVDLAVIVLGATLAGFLAKRTGQPTIIAYILAGVVLGPAVLGVVEVSELTELLSELGLAFLLFLLGIKMRLDEVRHVLSPIVKISIPQMTAVFLAGMGVALALDFGLLEAFLIGLAVMYSSTAVVIKMLTDKDEATSLHGKIDVGVLLVQDIVVVIILAVLAAGRPDDLAEVATTLGVVLVLVAIITIAAIGASRSVLPTIFRRIADDKDVFFLVALSWAFLFVFVSDNINLFLAPFGIEAYLSIEMGAFMAGLAIAQLPYSKELQDRVNPLTDLFVMVFFVSVALDLEAAQLLEYWQEAIVAALILMPVKFVIFFYLIDWQGFDTETTFLGSINMIQVSEFGIIVAAVAFEGGFIEPEVLGFMTLLAIFTMSVSVYFVEFNHALFDRFEPTLERWTGDGEFEGGKQEYRDHAVVIGYDDVTKNALPLLADRYEDVVVVDRTVNHVETLEEEGYDAIYGDFRNSTIRKDAAVKKADFVLSWSVQVAVNKALLREVSEDATVFVEAEQIEHARDLYANGAHCVIMTPHLAADRLATYLRAYLEDEEDTLVKAMDSDVKLLEKPDPIPSDRDRLGGELDD
ncbi:cation:proton antiporter [Natronobacterium gregoryi]|uniref:Kef-type K+ transport system, membrane component n=2 Tax=Natronobacterium gregoryi TaxID=44930 RepID=L0AJP5_NATGS|nr:cation:proton antiporter [Natronobacterium gregoryi]AFZ74093.1 Kef-type K+ transport system, membrane component [Natronobacterium gregoryi SP2]ELY70301.1 sodium/hydrogen exchanger [Natronobacterium gregoryi SP2]PLK18632.1 potassium transporter Kef [Natronobacterium gregoryi SP2]SFJ61912.1 Kef-type K+ transport system, membrane component KefB [Natronobacterium gregoryi]